MCTSPLQGYGLTETCAASCIAVPDDYALHGTNGPVTPCTEVMLESVPGGWWADCVTDCGVALGLTAAGWGRACVGCVWWGDTLHRGDAGERARWADCVTDCGDALGLTNVTPAVGLGLGSMGDSCGVHRVKTVW
jgi:hypothetical protein